MDKTAREQQGSTHTQDKRAVVHNVANSYSWLASLGG